MGLLRWARPHNLPPPTHTHSHTPDKLHRHLYRLRPRLRGSNHRHGRRLPRHIRKPVGWHTQDNGERVTPSHSFMCRIGPSLISATIPPSSKAGTLVKSPQLTLRRSHPSCCEWREARRRWCRATGWCRWRLRPTADTPGAAVHINTRRQLSGDVSWHVVDCVW